MQTKWNRKLKPKKDGRYIIAYRSENKVGVIVHEAWYTVDEEEWSYTHVHQPISKVLGWCYLPKFNE